MKRNPGSMLELDGITIEVIRKRVRNINLTVTREGEVRVSVPLGCPDEELMRVLVSRLGWIRWKRAETEGERRPERAYVTGEAFYLFGERYTLRTEVREGRGSLILQGEEALLTAGRDAASRAAFVKRWYRERLQEGIALRLPEWERTTGLLCRSVAVRDMKTRWGSCHVRERRIVLNLALVRKPPRCLDYVILHELMHFLIPHHGREFEEAVGRYMPDQKEAVRLLKERPDDFMQGEL